MGNEIYPKISLVTPSFNQGQFIEETIQSVLDQQYPNLEYIIIDGGSTDESVRIIKQYSKHLKYWISEKDKGQSDAINKGLKHCTGEIFNWLNSDDLLMDGAFEKLAGAFSDKRVEIVCGREIHFNETSTHETMGTLLFHTLEETIFQSVIYQPSTFWRLDKFLQVSPVDTRLRYMMDADLWVKYLLLNGQDQVIRLPDPLVRFRLHANSKTVSEQHGFKKEFWSMRKALFEQLGLVGYSSLMDELGKPIEFEKYDIHQSLDIRFLERLVITRLLEENYANGNYTRARELLSDLKEKHPSRDPRLKKYAFRLMIPDRILQLLS